MIKITRMRSRVCAAILSCAALLAVSCGGSGGGSDDPSDPEDDTPSGVTQSANPAALSAQTLGVATAFADTAIDSAGNLYAVGSVMSSMGESETFDFGNSITVTVDDGYRHPVLVKYDAAGVARHAWTYPRQCSLNAICVASDGSMVVAGSVGRTTGEEIQFADGVSLEAPTWAYDFTLEFTFAMKLDATGVPLWVSADLQGGGTSESNEFKDVCLDSSGNVYAAGYISGTSVAGYINGQVIDGSVGGASVAIVKYDATGTPLWGKSTDNGSGFSTISRIAADASGNLYAIATFGDGTCLFGDGVTVDQTIQYTGNGALIKYSTDGTALWARTAGAFNAGVDTTWAEMIFIDLGLDGSGNAYVAGTIADDISYNFGDVAVSGRGSNSQTSLFLIKYDGSGNGQWAVSVTGGGSASMPTGLAVDSAGNSFVCGSFECVDTLEFGNGVSVHGSAPYISNPLLVKIGSDGTALWAKTQIAGTASGSFKDVMLKASGGCGAIATLSAGSHGFGDGVTITADDASATLVSYGN